MSDGIARVLIVEVDEDELQIYSSLLHYNNFDVTQACNAYEAIEAAWSAPPDIVLMDLMLPGPNGFSAIETRKANPKSNTIPVLCFTARNIDRKRAIELGCVDLLHKPVEAKQLVATILKCLKERKSGSTETESQAS
jgi:DNA-binding response OmpR family regulator